MASLQSQLRLEQVSLKAPIGAQYLLQDLSFDVFQGDCVGIVGASGAGKTTLLKTLNRLSEISQGRILFENQDIRQIPVIQLRQQITLVPQESRLLGMTVRQALIYPLVLRKVEPAIVEQHLQTWLERLHIPNEWLERTEVQLSVGQRQLVAIARALMIQPKVLLLDEPTSALDVGRSEFLLTILQELTKTAAITVLMVNHQVELVQRFCSRLLYLQQGRLVQAELAEKIDWTALKKAIVDEQIEAVNEWN